MDSLFIFDVFVLNILDYAKMTQDDSLMNKKNKKVITQIRYVDMCECVRYFIPSERFKRLSVNRDIIFTNGFIKF